MVPSGVYSTLLELRVNKSLIVTLANSCILLYFTIFVPPSHVVKKAVSNFTSYQYEVLLR